MTTSTVNLFIYGSLRDPRIFESVCGQRFTLKPSHATDHILFAELALLPGYRRVSPDNVYYYAVTDPNAKIEGFVIYDLPAVTMAEIDRYEGKFYTRETVQVNTAKGPVQAQAYLASHRQMAKQFGDRFHVNLIHELWLRKRIAKFFQTHVRPGEHTADADIERRARRELLGTTERDLVISHLGSEAVSDFFIEHELDRPHATTQHLFREPEAKPFLENYVRLVVKQVLLNTIEGHIQTRHRYQLDHMLNSMRYYNRSLSLLIALRLINNNPSTVDSIIRGCLKWHPIDSQAELIDYVKYAISAADSMYDNRVVQAGLDWINANRQPGIMPLGAELELSNLGFRAVDRETNRRDLDFDNFKYFDDFGMNVLSWKLGGYIDDHRGTDQLERKCGFLELAPGRLNIRGEISKPATCDPWILNQLIMNIADFYPIKPHSLHITLQMRKGQYGNQKILPLGFVKCLLALGGGTRRTRKGRVHISRMKHEEIEQNVLGEEFIFARTSRRKPNLIGDLFDDRRVRNTEVHTQQYKFIRLDRRANYEALIMALKGLQIAYNPADYLTTAQLMADKRLRYHYRLLKEWSDNPTEISRGIRSRFLATIREGLMKEGHNRPVHKLHYIDWAIGAIDVQLRLFNKAITKRPA